VASAFQSIHVLADATATAPSLRAPKLGRSRPERDGLRKTVVGNILGAPKTQTACALGVRKTPDIGGEKAESSALGATILCSAKTFPPRLDTLRYKI
jgi:hypothetical protein